MFEEFIAPLEEALRPRSWELDLGAIEQAIVAAERELRLGALGDRDRCCGYFPALAGVAGIRSELPACRAFAAALPEISHGGMSFAFSFLRLSLVRQGGDPAFHLDSDAATALTGDVDTLSERVVLRVLLNLSDREPRVLQYLDVDPGSTHLVARGSYVCIRDPESVRARVRVAVIPPRERATVRGLWFVSNRVLHSGVDGERGHFVAAYGTETDGSAETR